MAASFSISCCHLHSPKAHLVRCDCDIALEGRMEWLWVLWASELVLSASASPTFSDLTGNRRILQYLWSGTESCHWGSKAH